MIAAVLTTAESEAKTTSKVFGFDRRLRPSQWARALASKACSAWERDLGSPELWLWAGSSWFFVVELRRCGEIS